MNNEIILYHYPFSPHARRIVWYLNFRGIPFTQCLQPNIMPRPDLAAIGTQYRRIPCMSIGKDIYNDTRLILRKLEELYPSATKISATSPEQKAIERLLEFWHVDGGVFARAAQLIPVDAPLLRDPAFVKDRLDMTGRKWDRDTVLKMLPEAQREIESAFEILETTFLADGRDWILATESPTLADIEAVWPFHWLTTMPGALPPNLISPKQFPKVFSYIKRFGEATKIAAKRAGKPKSVKGPEALSILSSSTFAEPEGSVDESEPTGLKKGQEVEVWPIDSGFTRRDRGSLVRLNGHEIVVDGQTKDGVAVRIHTPRHGFRVKVAGASKL